MGKVLNAMKKSAGARRTPATPATPATPGTPGTPATPPVKAAETVDNARTHATTTISKTVKTGASETSESKLQSAITAAMSAAALTEKTTTPSLDAVSAAVQQATQKAVEKLSPDLRKEYTPPQVKNLVVAPSKKDATATPQAKTHQKSAAKTSDTVIKAVAAGQTVIRPKKTFKTSITPVIEESPASAQTASPVKTNKLAIPDIASLLTEKPIAPAKPAAPATTPATHRPVSRAVSRADTLAAVRAKNGPVATRQSHYFSPLVVTHNKPRCQISEQFRHIRTALIRLANRGPVRCMITSSQPREGKTVTAVNMAYCFSEVTKKRTLLIDADLRRGRVSDLLGMGRKNGLSELLNGECTIEEATWSAGRPNFHVITAGAGSIEQIGEMLSGEQAEHVMTSLSRMYDNIIIDSPPVISVADPAILCRWVDMALMAVRIHSTHCNLIEQATQILEGVGVHVTGLIALDDKASQRNYYRYVNYG